MEILLILFIVFIVIPLLRILFSVGRTVHSVKKEFNRQSQQYSNTRKQQEQKREKTSRKERARAYFKETSEDVEFEEIKTERNVSGTNVQGKPQSADTHITDAPYEDIK